MLCPPVTGCFFDIILNTGCGRKISNYASGCTGGTYKAKNEAYNIDTLNLH